MSLTRKWADLAFGVILGGVLVLVVPRSRRSPMQTV